MISPASSSRPWCEGIFSVVSTIELFPLLLLLLQKVELRISNNYLVEGLIIYSLYHSITHPFSSLGAKSNDF